MIFQLVTLTREVAALDEDVLEQAFRHFFNIAFHLQRKNRTS
jgi:hypothetical protein